MIEEVARVAVAAALLAAAASKLADRKASRESIAAFGVPHGAAGTLGWTLIGSESAIAAAVLFDPSKTVGAAAALVLLAIVSAAVAANLVRARNPECHCFGRLSSGPIGSSTLARNGFLAAIAGYVAASGRAPAVFAGLAAASGVAWLTLGPLRPRARRSAEAPRFALADVAGARWTLPALLGKRHPVLLVFSQPSCGGCRAIRTDLDDWHARLGDRMTVAVVEHTHEADPSPTTRSCSTVVGTSRPRTVCRGPECGADQRNGRLASALATGTEEIDELVRRRFGLDDAPRFERRTLIVRAARGATALGAFPLIAAACGSSSSSSSTSASTKSVRTATTSTPPTSLKVGDAYICHQKYALCTNAPCRPDPHNPKVVICDCVVENGYSVGLTPCANKVPHGNTLYSTFSTELVVGNVRAMTCGADIAWANCVDFPCTLDPNDPSKATCQCALVKTGPSFTFGGNCDTGTCGKTVWSGAHTTLGGPQVAEALMRLGQPLATPKPCPKA